MSLRVKLLLIRLHVHIALQLSTGCAELEAELTSLSAAVHTRQAGHTTVLKRVLETGSEVGNELLDRTVDYVSIPQSNKSWDRTYPR